ncbi:MAG: M48 family metallopeptidase [Hyphomicrobiales bacterium]|nr:M48 family metallopeptidase [Hyphomicrobiales bacterium]
MGLFAKRKLSRSPEPEAVNVDVGGRSITVALRRHHQARRLKLSHDPAQRRFVLTLPARGRLDTALAFLDAQSDWIGTCLERQIAPQPFRDGAVVPLRGVDHRIVHRPGRRGTVWRETDDALPLLAVAGKAPFLARRIEDYLRREARADLAAAAARHGATLEVKPTAIRLRDQKSRWGSCSATGVLNFSWRLVLAPPDILDYVAAHEVAHLVEANHSPRFWALVDRLIDDPATARAWLKEHGRALHAYGAEH